MYWNNNASTRRGMKIGCNHKGYFVFCFRRKQYKLHRLIMLLRGDMTLEEFHNPKVFVDHIDGNGLNNNKENLRLVDNKTNQHNQRIHREGRPVGTIIVNGKMYWRDKI